MEIQEIKRALTLSKVLHYYHLKADKNLRLHCPFHDDKTPSMQVYYKTHTAYCFSSKCKTHGKSLDMIDFIMYKENCTKAEAIKMAEGMIKGELSMVNENNKVSNINNLPLSINVLSMPKAQFLGNMFQYFKNAVHNSKPAQEYIKSRGLDAVKIEEGCNTAQFHHGARRDETLINNCVAVGILSPWGTSKTGEVAYKAFAKFCVCFALRDKANNITGLYFRSTVNNSEQKHFYLKDSVGLYPNYPHPDTKKLIITECIIDCASLLQIEYIYKNYGLLSAYGTNRLNDEMKSAIVDLPHLEEIIFAFDKDKAGDTAVLKYAEELKNLLPSVKFSKLDLPNKDVNETLIAHNEDVFLHLLENRNFFLSTGGGSPLLFEENTLPLLRGTPPPPVEKKESGAPPPQQQQLNTNNPNNRPQGASEHLLNTQNANKIIYSTPTSNYYILGGVPKQLDMLKVMLQIENTDGVKSRNKIDLYEDKQVEKLSREVGEKLAISKDILENELYKLTDLLEEYREQEQQASKNNLPNVVAHAFTVKEKLELEDFLKNAKVLQNIKDLLGKTGIVGEESNRMFLFLIALSYKMKDPLHALVQGSSGSGKTRIVRQISDCMPQECVTRFTRISDKALYNYPQNYFTNRLLIIEDVDGLSEEAEMAFRELQSSGELRSSVSIKLENGGITGGEKVVSGPIASMSCTTKGEVYEDNMSRVFLIAVDESMEQTKRIIDYQNQKASGKINSKAEQESKTFIQNVVRILTTKEVINPYAELIQLPEEAHKIRRLNDLFQNFIKMITLIHQYQRKKTEQGKLIAEIQDVETAIEIMFESIVLKVDELDGSLRQFYEKLKHYLQQNYKEDYSKIEFTQREIRHALHISKAQINRYLQNLTELEYLSANGFANKGFKYKITYWDNYEALRKRIKEKLLNQITNIKVRATSEPLQSH